MAQRIKKAGIEANTHLIMKITIEPKLISMSLTMTWIGLVSLTMTWIGLASLTMTWIGSVLDETAGVFGGHKPRKANLTGCDTDETAGVFGGEASMCWGIVMVRSQLGQLVAVPAPC